MSFYIYVKSLFEHRLTKNIMKNIFFFLAIIGMLAACKKPHDEGGTTPPPPPPPGGGTGTVAVTEVGQPTGPAIIKTIGTGGGTISSADGKVILTIPAGALDKNEIISMEPIQNKAPLGIGTLAYRFLPHGLQFKKPAVLSFKYNDPNVLGASPLELKVATQLNNKTWRRLSNVSIDTNARTIKANLQHFSDYSVYTSIKMEDYKTKTDTAVVHVSTGEKVKFRTWEEVELDSVLTIPMPAFPRQWFVNGKENPSVLEGIGGLTAENGVLVNERDYNAPAREPDPDTIAISAKFDLGSKGVMWLVRTVVIDDINKTMINGKLYEDAFPAAIIVHQAKHLSLGTQMRMPNGKIASVSVSIDGIFDTTEGTFGYNGSEKVTILAQDEFGHSWSSQRTLLPSGIKEYTGRVQISVFGTAPNIYLIGTITGNLFPSAGTTGNGPVEVVFALAAH